jgi:hypothetical protein
VGFVDFCVLFFWLKLYFNLKFLLEEMFFRHSIAVTIIIGFDAELLLNTDPATWSQNKDYAAMQIQHQV